MKHIASQFDLLVVPQVEVTSKSTNPRVSKATKARKDKVRVEEARNQGVNLLVAHGWGDYVNRNLGWVNEACIESCI